MANNGIHGSHLAAEHGHRLVVVHRLGQQIADAALHPMLLLLPERRLLLALHEKLREPLPHYLPVPARVTPFSDIK
eukprot:7036158-Pyramimonas_sp.AAC.1